MQKSVASMTMLSDGVLLSGGGNQIKAWDSLMRFKLIKERVVSLPRPCHRQTLLTCRSASSLSLSDIAHVSLCLVPVTVRHCSRVALPRHCHRQTLLTYRSASSLSPSVIAHVLLCLVPVTVRHCSRVALPRPCHRQTLLT